MVAVRENASKIFDSAVQVEAGDRYTIIQTYNGDVYTFGLNENGKLGLDPETVEYALYPTKNNNISNVMLISAGTDHAVVSKTNGETYSWGTGTVGQLGNRELKDSYTPVMVGPYIVRTNERHIVLGKTDTYTLKAKTEYFNIIKEPKIGTTGVSKDTTVAKLSTLPDSDLTQMKLKKDIQHIK